MGWTTTAALSRPSVSRSEYDRRSASDPLGIHRNERIARPSPDVAIGRGQELPTLRLELAAEPAVRGTTDDAFAPEREHSGRPCRPAEEVVENENHTHEPWRRLRITSPPTPVEPGAASMALFAKCARLGPRPTASPDTRSADERRPRRLTTLATTAATERPPPSPPRWLYETRRQRLPQPAIPLPSTLSVGYTTTATSCPTAAAACQQRNNAATLTPRFRNAQLARSAQRADPDVAVGARTLRVRLSRVMGIEAWPMQTRGAVRTRTASATGVRGDLSHGDRFGCSASQRVLPRAPTAWRALWDHDSEHGWEPRSRGRDVWVETLANRHENRSAQDRRRVAEPTSVHGTTTRVQTRHYRFPAPSQPARTRMVSPPPAPTPTAAGERKRRARHRHRRPRPSGALPRPSCRAHCPSSGVPPSGRGTTEQENGASGCRSASRPALPRSELRHRHTDRPLVATTAQARRPPPERAAGRRPTPPPVVSWLPSVGAPKRAERAETRPALGKPAGVRATLESWCCHLSSTPLAYDVRAGSSSRGTTLSGHRTHTRYVLTSPRPGRLPARGPDPAAAPWRLIARAEPRKAPTACPENVPTPTARRRSHRPPRTDARSLAALHASDNTDSQAPGPGGPSPVPRVSRGDRREHRSSVQPVPLVPLVWPPGAPLHEVKEPSKAERRWDGPRSRLPDTVVEFGIASRATRCSDHSRGGRRAVPERAGHQTRVPRPQRMPEHGLSGSHGLVSCVATRRPSTNPPNHTAVFLAPVTPFEAASPTRRPSRLLLRSAMRGCPAGPPEEGQWMPPPSDGELWRPHEPLRTEPPDHRRCLRRSHIQLGPRAMNPGARRGAQRAPGLCGRSSSDDSDASTPPGLRHSARDKAYSRVRCRLAPPHVSSRRSIRIVDRLPWGLHTLRRLQKRAATYAGLATPGSAAPSGFLNLLTPSSARNLSGLVSCR